MDNNFEIANIAVFFFFLILSKDEQRYVQSDCIVPWFVSTSLTMRGSMLLLECKLHYVPSVYRRVFNKYTKYVNIYWKGQTTYLVNLIPHKFNFWKKPKQCIYKTEVEKQKPGGKTS